MIRRRAAWSGRGWCGSTWARESDMRTLSTTAPFGFEFDATRYLETYRALGCRWAEFYRNPDRPPTPVEALRIADSAGVHFDSVHGLFGWHIDPSSPEADHRDKCLKIYEDEGRLALDLGAPMVVVHPSANYPDNRPIAAAAAERAEEARWASFDNFAKKLAAMGERLNVTYLIENVPRNFPLGHRPGLLADRVRAIGSKRLRMCFDVGHAHITGDVVEALRSCADVVAYMHIHDNNGFEDAHWMPGDGSLPWVRLGAALRELRLHVPCMLEVFYALERVEQLVSDGLGRRLEAMCALELAPARPVTA